MRHSFKTAMLVVTTSFMCSMTTSACTNTGEKVTIEDTMIATDSGYIDKNLFTVSNRTVTPTDFTYAAEQTINGVVSIKSFATPRSSRYSNDAFSDPFFDFFFGNPYRRRQQQEPQQQPEQQQLGLGSGVIISADGYIVTNNHVIDGAERLEITLNDNRTFEAVIIGTDATTDLALIKIEAENLPVIPIGNSESLKVGEWVLAVGNPFGFTSTVTAGIVSAKARNISSITNGRAMGIESFIQTDAAVNPGNSGGALVNTSGELVGINTAIYSQTGNYAGYSFAIPTTIVTKIVTDLKQYGTVQRAILGIGFNELTPKLAKEKNITVVNAGLYVGRVEERSAAMEAGIAEGDVIVAINGVETLNSGQLQEQMSKYRPGDKISVSYIRDNKKHTVNVTLRNNQGDTKVTKAKDMMELGCAFKTVPAETLRQLQIRNGVQVSGLKDGKFKDAGIKEGFIIIDINNTRVSSQSDVEKIYDAIIKSDEYDKVMFITGIYPTGKKVYYAVDIAD
ncbi:MAG: Do family serine endopeptidase [Muribaculaceae bacterium]|nr:Do family serine endopeptidase [Muribaculaceae bacterium]